MANNVFSLFGHSFNPVNRNHELDQKSDKDLIQAMLDENQSIVNEAVTSHNSNFVKNTNEINEQGSALRLASDNPSPTKVSENRSSLYAERRNSLKVVESDQSELNNQAAKSEESTLSL